MAAQLAAFSIQINGGEPIYKKPCERCLAPLPLSGLVISIDKLDVLKKTPDEIKKLSETEIAHLRSLLPKTYVEAVACPCPRPLETTLNVKEGISPLDMCHCTRICIKILRSGSLSFSCPICKIIICSIECYESHIKHIHSGQHPDPSLSGYEWCPLCRTVSKKATGPIKDTIENKLCSRCATWDDTKLLEIPPSLKKEFSEFSYIHNIYSSASSLPPYVSQPSISFESETDLTTVENYPKFFINLLKHPALTEITDSSLDFRFLSSWSHTIPYQRDIWKKMLYAPRGQNRFRLRSPEEIKVIPLLGTEILAAVRREISLLEAHLNQTSILPPLCCIICTYLPYQLWNFERLLSRIHADALKYGPPISALISLLTPPPPNE
ncbi:MAG: hypothetical protein Hyperionvirus2_219 [Hyperionvirus sp.]|uniref:C2H2-type domain-containing protein n=1 Tax=Hyperionvirus sp. TaxID=2487770 RepID=A0A3G5A9I8_9VIRU|nr:MAG: hypothetical protein Hyperionvirus2_219 [Hyperionvirus sp.]